MDSGQTPSYTGFGSFGIEASLVQMVSGAQGGLSGRVQGVKA